MRTTRSHEKLHDTTSTITDPRQINRQQAKSKQLQHRKGRIGPSSSCWLAACIVISKATEPKRRPRACCDNLTRNHPSARRLRQPHFMVGDLVWGLPASFHELLHHQLDTCVDELAAFSGASYRVSAWKDLIEAELHFHSQFSQVSGQAVGCGILPFLRACCDRALILS